VRTTRLHSPADLDSITFSAEGGLVPVVAQDAYSGEVLMLGYADRTALARTLETGELWFWSRSRGRLWKKGETSGNVLRPVALHADCDGDAVLARVEPAGPTCHAGAWSCFDAPPTLAALARVLEARAAGTDAAQPTAEPGAPGRTSYTARLLADRNLRLKKLGEEAVELALACADDAGDRAAEEAADLIYHALVAALAAGSPPAAVLAALERRLPRPVPPADDEPIGREEEDRAGDRDHE